jgi:hypothetical protein
MPRQAARAAAAAAAIAKPDIGPRSFEFLRPRMNRVRCDVSFVTGARGGQLFTINDHAISRKRERAMLKTIIAATFFGFTLSAPASAALITSLPEGVSAGVPAANEMTAGPRLFGPGVVPTITYTASQPMALYGWTGSYFTNTLNWTAGGPPIIGNNVFTPSTVTLTFATPIQAFLADLNWELQFGAIGSFSAYDLLGNLLETQMVTNGNGTTNVLTPGGSYGFLRPTAEISRIEFSNAALGFRNLLVAQQVSPAAVPEPGTWAMLLLGFAMVGLAFRRRGNSLGKLQQLA